MTQISISITGLTELQNWAERGPARLRAEIETAVAEAVFFGHEYIALYPPVIPSSTYEQTGLLGKSWVSSIHRTSDSVQGLLGNDIYYGPYVQDALHQASVHRGRWRTVQGLTEGSPLEKIVSFFVDAVARVVKAIE